MKKKLNKIAFRVQILNKSTKNIKNKRKNTRWILKNMKINNSKMKAYIVTKKLNKRFLFKKRHIKRKINKIIMLNISKINISTLILTVIKTVIIYKN